jgi:transcriptional regulator with XRE-family HTH domain
MVRGSPNPRYFGLPARLRKARKQAGLTRKGLVKLVGGDQSTVRDIETNQRLPTVGTIARLASALQVSAAWLGFGLGDPELDGSPATCEGMGSRLAAVRSERGLTKAALARLIKVTPRTVAVIEGGGQAKVQTVESFAQALGVSPAWLAFHEGPQVLPSRRGRPPAQPSAPLG